jgi:hypothetical protein
MPPPQKKKLGKTMVRAFIKPFASVVLDILAKGSQKHLWVETHSRPFDSSLTEFLNVIGTKVFRVFLLAIHSHLY